MLYTIVDKVIAFDAKNQRNIFVVAHIHSNEKRDRAITYYHGAGFRNCEIRRQLSTYTVLIN